MKTHSSMTGRKCSFSRAILKLNPAPTSIFTFMRTPYVCTRHQPVLGNNSALCYSKYDHLISRCWFTLFTMAHSYLFLIRNVVITIISLILLFPCILILSSEGASGSLGQGSVTQPRRKHVDVLHICLRIPATPCYAPRSESFGLVR